ncbi:MAG: hypothetical protein IID41_07260 [Planctomycetes bacterium]|nr:hypothetical protein [Planctomycetota bacterium]
MPDQQLQAIKLGLMSLRAMINDAQAKGDHEKPAAMKRFMADEIFMVEIIELQVDSLLGYPSPSSSR